MKITKKFKKRYLLFLFVPVILFVLIVGIYYIKIMSKIKRPTTNIEENVLINEQAPKSDKKTMDIALFGVDSRDTSLKEGNRSDVVMIAHIDEDTDQINLFSIYRDSYVNIPGKGLDKLTHAYAYGGPELALSTINKNYDLNVTKFVTVNFVALEKAINLLGGVEIDVQQDEVKWINGYVHSLNQESGLNEVSYISGAGKQTLNGSQAVAYCRIRYTGNGDVDRAARHRRVLNEMLNKAKQSDISTLLSMIDEMSSKIYTNLSVSEINSFAKNIISYQIEKSEGFPYNINATSAMCAADSSKALAVNIPTNYIQDLIKLHTEIMGNEEYEPSDTVKEYEQGIASYQIPVTTTQAATTTQATK